MKLKLPFGNKAPASPTGEMTLVGHLSELRKRLIRSVTAVIVGAIVVYIFKDPIFDFLAEPYCEFQVETGEDECRFLVTAPLQAFSVMLTMAGYGGLILATPVILYQMGRFILPGLYPHEKKAMIPFAVASVALLAGGMTLAYYLMEKALAVLSDFGADTFESLYTPSEYLGFFVKMLFAFGVAAELPLVLIFLQMIGVVKTETLAKNRRIAVVAVVILGAFITPTGDPFTLVVISIPMYLFYEIAILVGKRMKKRKPVKGEGS